MSVSFAEGYKNKVTSSSHIKYLAWKCVWWRRTWGLVSQTFIFAAQKHLQIVSSSTKFYLCNATFTFTNRQPI